MVGVGFVFILSKSFSSIVGHHLALYLFETQQISNISSLDNNVIIIFENKNAANVVMNLSFYPHILFSCFFIKQNFHEFKVLKKISTTETFNVDFHKFIKSGRITGGPVVEFRLLPTAVVGSISSGGDYGLHCWWDPIWSE